MEENENLEQEVVETTQSDEGASEKIEQLTKALNEERGKRKSLEQKIKDSQKEEEEEIKSAEDEIRNILKNSKSDFSDETVEDLMNAFGKAQAKNQVKAAKKEAEREIMELKRDSKYRDVEEYGDEVRKLMKTGLSAKQAYWAAVGENKFSSVEDKKATEDAEKQNKERASQGFVDGVPAKSEKKPTFSSKEVEIARAIGMTAEEVKERSGGLSIDQILAANQKYKK